VRKGKRGEIGEGGKGGKRGGGGGGNARQLPFPPQEGRETGGERRKGGGGGGGLNLSFFPEKGGKPERGEKGRGRKDVYPTSCWRGTRWREREELRSGRLAKEKKKGGTTCLPDKTVVFNDNFFRHGKKRSTAPPWAREKSLRTRRGGGESRQCRAGRGKKKKRKG